MGIGTLSSGCIGGHFSAELICPNRRPSDATAGLMASRMWRLVFDIDSALPRTSAFAAYRAAIGGGLELACTAHIGVADPSVYYALPEGSRGISLVAAVRCACRADRRAPDGRHDAHGGRVLQGRRGGCSVSRSI